MFRIVDVIAIMLRCNLGHLSFSAGDILYVHFHLQLLLAHYVMGKQYIIKVTITAALLQYWRRSVLTVSV